MVERTSRRGVARARWPGLLLAAVLLQGCAGARREPVPIDVALPAAHRGAGSGDALRSGAELPWWDTWRDPALTRLVERALERNRDIQFAVARIEETRALLGPAAYAELPQLSVAANTGRERLPQSYRFALPPGTDRDVRLYGTAVSASYELDLWGRLRSLQSAVRADFLASRYARETVAITLVGEVAQTYFDILAARQQLALTRDTLERRRAFLDLTRRRFDGGRASAVEVARAEGNLLGVQSRLPGLEQQLAQLENRLAVLVGTGGDEAGSLVPVAAALPAPPEVPAGLPSALLERRPDLLAAQQELEAASFRADAQRAALLPTISLTASLGLQSRSLGDLLSGSATTFALGAGILQPLIDASRNTFLVQAQEARERQALIRYQRVAEQALREVSDALIARSRQAELRDTLAAQVTALARAAALAEARFKAGAAAYFEVLDAQSELLAAQLAENDARRAVLAASVGLYKSLGGAGTRPPSRRACRRGRRSRCLQRPDPARRAPNAPGAAQPLRAEWAAAGWRPLRPAEDVGRRAAALRRPSCTPPPPPSRRAWW
jgi:multidrug efflux system outer membrane protein